MENKTIHGNEQRFKKSYVSFKKNLTNVRMKRCIRNSQYLGQSQPIDCIRMAHYGHVSQSYCHM